MKIKQYDTVRLKDGRIASLVEVFSERDFLADVGSSPRDWDTIDVTIDDIEAVLTPEEVEASLSEYERKALRGEDISEYLLL